MHATLDDFLHMTWLRPENVIWDFTACRLIGEELSKAGTIAEIGIGNGCFTFMTLGGKFKKEYDWYYNVAPEGFWQNRDIYDHVAESDISRFVESAPRKRIALAIDHKENLLIQARQLGFIDNTVVADANEPVDPGSADTVYSNILYWLNDPVKVLKNIAGTMKANARIVLAFPNPDFITHCRSYRRNSPTWTLLNRGRADSLMWTMGLDEFAAMLQQETSLEIEKSTKYLSRLTLQTWDIGFRPFSPHLIKMANKLDPVDRMEVKQEWCATAIPFLQDLAENEAARGPDEGGFNFVVLRKR
jgi:SAM-dependent methyltransferase